MVKGTVTRLWSGWRKAWKWWGWVESHVSRVLLIIFVVGILIAGGAIVIAWAEEVSLLTLYLVVLFVPLAMFTLAIWSAVGVRAWSVPPVADRAPNTEKTKSARTGFAKLHVTPLHDDSSLTLRVENLGAAGSVAIRMLRIGSDTGGSMPFRMRWEPTSRAQLGVPREPEKGQILLGIGDIRTVDVAYLRTPAKTKPASLAFQWPGGVQTIHVIAEDILEVEMDAQSDLEFKEAWHRIYVIGFNERRSKIVSFDEEVTDE